MDKKERAVTHLRKVVEKVKVSTPCIILFEGEQVRFPSMKSAWKDKRSASAALTNALGHWMNEEDRKIFGSSSELRKYLVEEGIVELKTFDYIW